MKKYIIGVMAALIIMLASFIFKYENNQSITRDLFPISNTEKQRVKVDVPMFIFVFFKQNNCHDCLQFIESLNQLPSYFVVTGIVPEQELKNEKELRQITGANFPLKSITNYRKFIPRFSPSIVGVSPYGDIYFVLPGVPGEKAYLQEFLLNFYGKVYPSLYERILSEKSGK